MVPRKCPDVPDSVLDPARAWPSREQYDHAYQQLAARFIDNFRKFADVMPDEVRAAGPVRK
jgi:phosphoenolpyruvate carboxykinase (ATP)